MRRFLAVLALIVPGLVSAQSHPLVGEWKVSVPAGMRVEDGEPTYMMATGVMTVSSTGDSLIAIMKMEPLEGMPPRPATRLAAKLVPGKVLFSLTSEAKVNVNGEESTMKAVSTFVLDAVGDQLVGTVTREIDGVAGMKDQPVKGTRTKP